MNIRKNKGITLVALVITIIVLLILAGVTISLLIGDNGIINHAKNSSATYTKSQIKEKIELAILDIEAEELRARSNMTMDKIVNKLEEKVDNLIVYKNGEEAAGICNEYDYIITKEYEVIIGEKSKQVQATKINLDKTDLDLYLSEQTKINAIVEPANTSNKKVKWTSSDENIVTIDKNGEIVAKSKGQATITAVTADGSNLNTSTNVKVEWSIPYNQTEPYTDNNGKIANIPQGFQTSLKEGQTNIADGLVVRNASDKNEFVWIPVDSISNYVRINFGMQSGSYSTYSEVLPVDEKTSVETYKGYYIGRYEAGKEDNKVIVQPNKKIYNFVAIVQAKELSNSLYNRTTNKVQSKLCSSYAWDIALRFIETKNAGWSNNSVGGNYSGTLKTTAQSTPKNNIYDMGGNALEWTTEDYSGYGVMRGGYNGNTANTLPASHRYYVSTTYGDSGSSFRITLFL